MVKGVRDGGWDDGHVDRTGGRPLEPQIRGTCAWDIRNIRVRNIPQWNIRVRETGLILLSIPVFVFELVLMSVCYMF